LHVIWWIISAVEPWLALRWMGAPLGFEAVLAIESLLYAVRSVVFAIPDALELQEGVYVRLCSFFGREADAALSLSLLKRAPATCRWASGPLAWQLMETSEPGGGASPRSSKPRPPCYRQLDHKPAASRRKHRQTRER
jgi:hypothetical protein